MKRNLSRVLYRHPIAAGKCETLDHMFRELYGDHHQVLQLAGMAGNTMKQNSVTIDGNTDDVKNRITIKTIQTYVNIPRADPLLVELNNIVQYIFKTAVSNAYGTFCSPNTSIISNKSIQNIVAKYKELMPDHHACISIVLNVNQKLKDKQNMHLENEYDRMSMWMFF